MTVTLTTEEVEQLVHRIAEKTRPDSQALYDAIKNGIEESRVSNFSGHSRDGLPRLFKKINEIMPPASEINWRELL